MGSKTFEKHARYSLVARLLHWIMAAGFLFMWASGFAMTTLVADDGPAEELLFSLHISIGVSLTALLAVRIAWRVIYPPPMLPGGLTAWEKKASHLGHLLLYLLPLAVIAIGWAETDFGGHGVMWFGQTMPKIFPTTETIFGFDASETTELMHLILAYAMLACVVVHIAAALKHRWIDGHDVLFRMSLGRAGPGPTDQREPT